VSEKVITRYKFGRPTRVWVKIRDRNEQLDLFVYDLAAFWLLRKTDEEMTALIEQLAAQGAAAIEAAKASPVVAAITSAPPKKGFVTGWK
jgi:phage terminase large subunit GpA-like protein